MTVYLALEQVLNLHRDQTSVYGGDTGLRDRGLLESPIARPAMTFGGDDHYPDVPSKAGVRRPLEDMVLNHPFVDGKRVGAQAAIVFVIANGWECLATPEELVEITLAVAEGKVAVEALTIWFRQRLRMVD